MNLKELSSPIRMYWDIGNRPNDPIDYRAVAQDIAACKFLTLQITQTGPKLTESCLAILDTLKGKPIALSLATAGSALDDQTLELLRPIQLKLLLVSAGSVRDVPGIVEISKRTGTVPVGVAFPVTRSNFQELPDVLRSCIDSRIETLVLPMQRAMYTGTECFSFSLKERHELTSHLGGIPRPSWFRVIIHDPFLWRAFFPSMEFPDGGCQAANTLLFISPDGDLYPCPTLPIPLGNVLQTALQDIISSRLKKKVRNDILSIPPVCSTCEQADSCKAGCRGRAYMIHTSLENSDPACR